MLQPEMESTLHVASSWIAHYYESITFCSSSESLITLVLDIFDSMLQDAKTKSLIAVCHNMIT